MRQTAGRSKSVFRVQEALRQAGLEIEVVELADSTRTAELAAQAIGTSLGSIAKSLVFMADGKPALVLVAGDRRASPSKVARALGAGEVRLAAADEVRAATGYAVGGVPPVGHATPMETLVDAGLARFEVVHAAAGSPHAVFPIRFADLLRVTGGRLTDIAEGGA